MTIRNLSNYYLSKDYEALYELAQKQSVVCIVDYFSCRDVCQTLYNSYSNVIEVCSRGHGYIFAENMEDFIAICEPLNLEWIVPTLCELSHS
jgi:hypothetical protein